MYDIGDIVLVYRGQKTRFFEVIKVEDGYVWVSDGHVQITKTFDYLQLICKARNRQDSRVPLIRYMP